jgi:thymidylate synthase
MINSINYQVHNLLNKIESSENTSSPRGLHVKELFLETLEIDPTFPILDFTARPMNWRYFLGEMAWYLQKDRNIAFINHFSSFWKGIADDKGYVCSNYGYLLFNDQLQWALNSLLKDPNTRQAIAFVSRPSVQFEGNKDFVCTMYLNFWIRDNKLNMKVQMRSNDVFYGLSYDVPFFAFVQQTMYFWLRQTYDSLEIGKYYHSADNIHYYEKHFDVASQITQESIKNPYFFVIRDVLFNIKNGSMKLTDAGKSFLNDVNNLISSGEKITQKTSKETLSKYFFIQ